MPRIRTIVAYPLQQFIALYQRVIDTQQPFVVPCTRPQAASMRGELYAFRRACEGSPGEAEGLGVKVTNLRLVSFRITDAGLECLLGSSLASPSLIEAALGGTTPITTPAQAALNRLRGLVGAGVADGS